MTREHRLTSATVNPAILLTTVFWFITRTQARVVVGTSFVGFVAVTAVAGQLGLLSFTAGMAPLIVVAFVSIHETAHWATLKWRLHSANIGVLVVTGTRIRVMRPALKDRDLLFVSGSGPVIGAGVAIACACLARNDWALTLIFAAIAVANIIGLTPWSGDGADLAESINDN